MARGQPKRPAPVSGPGALARRTDGGAGSDTQPLRAPVGGDYGERKALLDQQRAAPLPAAGSGGGASLPSAPTGQPTGIPGVFGPTERPNEPPTHGMQTRGQFLAGNVDQFISMLYSQFPHPALAALIRQRR